MADKKQGRKMYAWSNIQHGVDRDTTDPTVITRYHTTKRGSVVTADKLGLSDEQFQELVDAGSVRSIPYPDMPDTWGGSPVEWYREQARLAADNALTEAMESQESAFAATQDVGASSGQGTAETIAEPGSGGQIGPEEV